MSDAEFAKASQTDRDDLESAVHNLGGNIERLEDLEEDEEIADDDVPQEITESYGTGVHDASGMGTGGRVRNLNEATPELTGGDIDASYEQANAEGDESVGGTVSTPDMDIVDDLGKAVGLEMSDFNYLHTNEILEQRDNQRWELEPKSSDDYDDRKELEEEEIL